MDNEVGKMRRIRNSFLQFIESEILESVIIVATNNRQMLGQALFGRLDDVLHYELPTVDHVLQIVSSLGGDYNAATSGTATT